MRINLGDRVRYSPPATCKPSPDALKRTGTVGPILVDHVTERWNMARVLWDDGTESAELCGHLARLKN